MRWSAKVGLEDRLLDNLLGRIGSGSEPFCVRKGKSFELDILFSDSSSDPILVWEPGEKPFCSRTSQAASDPCRNGENMYRERCSDLIPLKKLRGSVSGAFTIDDS